MMCIFDESEHARLLRLYEIQRLYQDREPGNTNDFPDEISDASSYLPAEFEPSPGFLPRRRDEPRHRTTTAASKLVCKMMLI
jgi:hypothetical protein